MYRYIAAWWKFITQSDDLIYYHRITPARIHSHSPSAENRNSISSFYYWTITKITNLFIGEKEGVNLHVRHVNDFHAWKKEIVKYTLSVGFISNYLYRSVLLYFQKIYICELMFAERRTITLCHAIALTCHRKCFVLSDFRA